MIERIKLLMEKENLSNSRFSDEIELQRSSLSHILSGRNKPSLDFIMKVKNRFPDINTDWLIFGEGNMYENSLGNLQKPLDLFSSGIGNDSENRENKAQIIESSLKTEDNSKIDPESNEKQVDIEKSVKPVSKGKAPLKVLLLYENGTFDVFEN